MTRAGTPLAKPTLLHGAGLVGVIVGVSVLVGWAFDIGALKSILPGSVSVKPNTALAFALIGVAFCLHDSPGRFRSNLARCCGALAGVIGLLTLSEYVLGWNPGFDQWLFPEAAGTPGTSHPGRMAPDTACCFSALAAGLEFARTSNRRPTVVLGSIVATIGALAILARLTGFDRAGWWGLTAMAVPTSVAFVVLGTALASAWQRDALGSRLAPFARHLWQTVAGVAALVVAFVLYARSEGEIDRANELRVRSIELADELRQSGDDLTRMVRTYVVTGDPVYKEHFQDILAIRDGKKPRPENYSKPYWDLVLGNNPPPSGRHATPLLELMRKASFTEAELNKLAEAKANSDRLTVPEIEAMRLVEATGPELETHRAKARAMLYDAEYHRAKAGVMGPIRDFLVLVDSRTHAAVEAAEIRSRSLRYVFAAIGLALILVLWRAYAALARTLGGSVDEVYAHIAKLGTGDFSSVIQRDRDHDDSVMGWLGDVQVKLEAIARERKEIEEALRRHRDQLEEAVRERTGELSAKIGALRDSEERIRTTLYSIGDGVIATDGAGRVTRMNPVAEQVTGWSEAEAIGQPIAQVFHIVHEDTRAEVESPVARVLREDTAVELADHTVVISKDGTECPVADCGAPIRDEKGALTGVVLVFRDQTEERAAQKALRERTKQLEEANQELDAFSYSVSHDLRAPLRAIDGFTRILMDDYGPRLDDEGKRICSVVRDNTGKMGQLIDDLLAFSRLARVEVEPSPIDMAGMARAVFHELTTPEDRERIDFQLEALPMATGDPSLMRQVWMNLLGNAVKFSSKRERSVIRVSGETKAGEDIFVVGDNGAGFDMQYVSKLFGVFHRLHSAREFEGTGVGLALVQRVIRRHAGRVWAHGEIDHGATFSFALPHQGE